MSVNWLAFSKVFVFISVFGRFSVDERRKRIKMYAFSNENGLVWMGPYKAPDSFDTFNLCDMSRQGR